MIHLDEPRLQVLVHHHVETQNLEARVPVVSLGGQSLLVVIRQRGLRADDGLDDQVLDLGPHLVKVQFGVLHPLAEAVNRPLGSRRVAVAILVEDEVFVLLVHRVVRQVHVRRLEVRRLRRLVLLRAEPRQAVVKQEYPQRIGAQHEGVHAKIELVSVDEQRTVQVPLRHDRCSGPADVLPASSQGIERLARLSLVLHQRDSPPLASGVGLEDERLSPGLLGVVDGPELLQELFELLREVIRLRREVELVRVNDLEPRQVPRKAPLAAYFQHADKVVDLLTGLQPHEAVGGDGRVCPIQVPRVRIVVVHLLPSQF